MNNKTALFAFTGLLLTVTSMTTQATIIEDGTIDSAIYASSRTISNCPSYCTGDFQFDTSYDDGLSANAEENTYGTAKAFGDFQVVAICQT